MSTGIFSLGHIAKLVSIRSELELIVSLNDFMLSVIMHSSSFAGVLPCPWMVIYAQHVLFDD